ALGIGGAAGGGACPAVQLAAATSPARGADASSWRVTTAEGRRRWRRAPAGQGRPAPLSGPAKAATDPAQQIASNDVSRAACWRQAPNGCRQWQCAAQVVDRVGKLVDG